MLEIKDINKIKIINMDVDNIQFMYEDTAITLHDFKGTCTIVEEQDSNSEEKKYQIIECKIENFINKLSSLDTTQKFRFELYKNSITKEKIYDFVLCLGFYNMVKCDEVRKEKIKIEIDKFKSEIIDMERKILNLTREKELKEIALHVLEDVLEENSLVM